ncbi:hypothetical protein AYI70_g10988 [Smittium culicis]|uniref:Uncharacterized protein n=1 Tax=Smittium culicis TaxID=133412 RepID=A0A1R1X3V3_9FUNG|nr:hypothetical protein AYI70_g10988 [Smittium culicis]
METTNTGTHNEQSPSWDIIESAKTKSPDIIKRYENKFVPVSLFKTTTVNVPLKMKISCLGSTSLKLWIPMKEFNNNTEGLVENVLIQFDEIQSCFEIDNRRHILFLKFINKNDLENVKKMNITIKEKNCAL